MTKHYKGKLLKRADIALQNPGKKNPTSLLQRLKTGHEYLCWSQDYIFWSEHDEGRREKERKSLCPCLPPWPSPPVQHRWPRSVWFLWNGLATEPTHWQDSWPTFCPLWGFAAPVKLFARCLSNNLNVLPQLYAAMHHLL